MHGPKNKITLFTLKIFSGGRDNVVGTATIYTLEVPEIDSRWGRDFPHPFRRALGPKRPPIQWVPGLFPGGKAAGEWRWPPTQSSVEVKGRLQTLLAFITCSRVNLEMFPKCDFYKQFTQGLDLASNVYYRMYEYRYVISFFTQLWNTKRDDDYFTEPKHVAFLLTFIQCCVYSYLLLHIASGSTGWHTFKCT